MRSDPLRIRLSGRGGQGIILAGTMLAEAAMQDGLYVVQTQSYGPEARLGASKSEVVVASKEIAFPEVLVPDLVLCFSREAYLKFGKQVSPGGVVLLEESILKDIPDAQGQFLPLRRTARELGKELVLNVVGLGALVAITQAVSRESLRSALRHRVKPEFLDLNVDALEAGFRLGESVPSRA
ncbi:MAG: 2-oxoacid:acceptor oxidoreductase family protein [Thermaerobacter sp.]|nr:2-oxoacid:acceptor oxidoreductase family protein [Thermaerobacter sp.]